MVTGSSSESVLSCTGVGKTYESFALRDVTFDLQRGKILFLCGHNGSGKSTLLRLIGGREVPTSGTVRINDSERWISPHEAHELFTWIPQDVREVVADHTSVRELVSLVPGRSRVLDLAAKAGADWLIDIVKHRRDGKLAGDLSGGEKQLLAGIFALSNYAPLLLLDEVFRSLDEPTRDHYWNMLKAMILDQHASAIIVSHDLGFVCQQPDSLLLVLVRGRVQYFGPVGPLSMSELAVLVAGDSVAHTPVGGKVAGRAQE